MISNYGDVPIVITAALSNINEPGIQCHFNIHILSPIITGQYKLNMQAQLRHSLFMAVTKSELV